MADLELYIKSLSNLHIAFNTNMSNKQASNKTNPQNIKKMKGDKQMTKKCKREGGWNSWGGGGWLYLGGGLSCSPCCQAYIESGLGLPCSLPARCRVRFGTHDVGAPPALAGVAGAVAEVRDRRRDLLPVFAVLVRHGAGLCVG